jgi:hypothetical protein
MASSADFHWDESPDTLRLAIDRLEVQTRNAITAAFHYQAGVTEGAMKVQAPWTDRTGAARAGLHTDVQQPSRDEWVMILAHAVSYGIWLEVANNGRYAIVEPMLRQAGREFQVLLKSLWRRAV